MKIFKNESVLEASKKRIRWLFEEFENVVVSFSGGKDSTICFNLALEVARDLGKLPLKVMFLDQEAEWQATIDAVTEVMENPDVEPYWIQAPFKLFNATSTEEHWLECWDPAKEDLWVRPKVPYSIKENTFGTVRFKGMFSGIPVSLWPDKKTAFIAGVRCEESPARAVALTHSLCHKWVTWGVELTHGNKTFYPIYDWSTSDVWKAINEHGWNYCKLYDNLYRHGVSVSKMRVSNVHHETAVWALFVLQELEPKTYNRLVARIQGIDMAGKMGYLNYFPSVLPPMFGDWKEYRDFLLEKLITNEKWKEGMRKKFEKMDLDLLGFEKKYSLYQTQVSSIMCNDWEGIKLDNFMSRPEIYGVAKKSRKQRKLSLQTEEQLYNSLPTEETEA